MALAATGGACLYGPDRAVSRIQPLHRYAGNLGQVEAAGCVLPGAVCQQDSVIIVEEVDGGVTVAPIRVIFEHLMLLPAPAFVT